MIRYVAVFLLLASVVNGQPTNVRLSDPSAHDPEEVSIAINPRNPNQLAAGANIDYLFTSSDAGLSWTTSKINSQYAVWGDPCLLFDDSGLLYYEHLSGQNWQDPEFLWRIVVQRSTDAGRTFDQDEEIGLNPPTEQDKAWLGLDRSNTTSNHTLYTTWTEFDSYGSTSPTDSSRIYFSKSTDHGISWSERVRVDDTAGDCLDGSYTDEGATTAVSPDGTINCVWSARDRIYLARSSDGGRSFGKSRVIADQPGGWDFAIPGIYRGNGLPVLLSDLNPQSPYYGRLYVMWSDQHRSVADVYIIHSTDNGTSWSTAQRVNTDTTLNHHFFPSLTIDPITGRLYVVFYDRRNYSESDPPYTDIYMARSTDGGVTFTDQKISESAFNPVAKVFFGDYIHIAAYNGHVYPIWMRMDDSVLSVWTAIVKDSITPTGGQAVATIPPDRTELMVTGTPLQPGIRFQLPDHTHLSIELFDLVGKRIASLLDGEYGEGEYRIGVPQNIPTGAYIIRMTTNDRILTSKLIVSRN